ncbi:MAG: hypothetical protein HRU14_08715 [Planctomycetes bacterium]|nr:hypothetical protein [Planctomycetota bacterium]
MPLLEHQVSTGVTMLFTSILVALIACLALEEKIHAKKSVIAVTFALLCLFVGEALNLIPPGEVDWGGHTISLPVFIPSVDWSVISIILGASLFVDIVSKSGLFTWIAIRLTRVSGGDPKKLLWFYGLMTVVFSAVLNNVTAMIIVGSLTAVSLEKLGRRDKLLGFLLTEGLLTNIGGLLTLISSVPNIIVGTAAGISFVSFLIRSAPFVVVATVATILLGARIFGIKNLGSEAERAEARELVAGFDENDGIESKGFFWFGAIMTGLFVVVIASASSLPVISNLGMGYVALLFAGIMLVRYKHVADRFYQAIDWDLLAFFAALFVTINVMEHAGVLELIGDGLKVIIGDGERVGQGSLLVSAAAFSSVTDNIPLAAMLAKILGSMPAGEVSPGLWWAVIFGANLGGNLTPIGSASTLVAVTIMHKHELTMTFGRFVKMAIPFALMHIALALVYVLTFL